MKCLGKIVFSLMAVSMGVIAILLFVEYRFFHNQAQKMMELKEEYRTYVMAVKKVLNEYNALKEQADGAQDSVETAQNAESDSEEGKEPFPMVNRELSYLKQSMVNYMKQQNLEFVMQRIDLNEFVDYTDQVIQSQEQKKQGRTRARRVTRRASVAPVRRNAWPKPDGNIYKDLLLTWPIDRAQFWISSFFGPRRKPDKSWGFHYGIDMASVKGNPVKAAADGVVVEATHSQKGYGNTIVVAHDRKYKTRYAHLHKILVTPGQKVERGQLIGKVGSTGVVRSKKGRDASHLHFEVYCFGKQINPLYFFM